MKGLSRGRCFQVSLVLTVAGGYERPRSPGIPALPRPPPLSCELRPQREPGWPVLGLRLPSGRILSQACSDAWRLGTLGHLGLAAFRLPALTSLPVQWIPIALFCGHVCVVPFRFFFFFFFIGLTGSLLLCTAFSSCGGGGRLWLRRAGSSLWWLLSCSTGSGACRLSSCAWA